MSKIAKGPGIGIGARESVGGPSNSPSFREETFQLQNLALGALERILSCLLHALGERTSPNHNIESINDNGESEAGGSGNNHNASSSGDEGSCEGTDETDAVLQVTEEQHQQPINGIIDEQQHHHRSNPTTPSSRSPERVTHGLDSKKKIDEQISSHLWKFNVNPVEEVKSLQVCGLVGATPADVARFLHTWSRKLDKTAIGDYLCFEKGSSKGGFNALVLHEYVDQMDLSGFHIDEAIHEFLNGFRLSREDEVEWVVKKVVQMYCLQKNPTTVFPSEERAFRLANAIVFLNMDLENSARNLQWTSERFINENRSKEEEDGGWLCGTTSDNETCYLRDVFDRIKRNPISVVEHPSRTSTSVIHAYDRKKKMDEQLSNGILRFNLSSTKGVDRLQACGAVGKTPSDVAKFLHSWSEKLDKAAIGEYLSREKEYKGGFNVLVLHEYVDQMNFSGLRFDDAIRHYLSGFRLPGEAQKIDRMMEKFAERYCLENPAVFPSADTAFILAFSVIMLNTDLHNPAIREDRRMTVEGFISNNRGIGDGSNLDEEFLCDIFYSIQSDPIRLKEDDDIRDQLVGTDSQDSLGLGHYIVYGLTGTTSAADRAKRQAAYDKERVDMLRSSQALVRMRRQEEKLHTTKDFSSMSTSSRGFDDSGQQLVDGGQLPVQEDSEGNENDSANNNGNSNKFLVSDMALSEADALVYVKAMFDVAWWPMLGAFSQVLEECCGQSIGELSSPEGIGGVMVKHCLGGCRLGLRLSARCIGSFLPSMPAPQLSSNHTHIGEGSNEMSPLVNNVSREAFMNTIGKFTLLDTMWGNGTYNSIREIRSHNLSCIHALLDIALEDGDYLEESWGVVLRLLSQLARLLILAEGLAADGDFFEHSPQEPTLERKGSSSGPGFIRTASRAKLQGAKWQKLNAVLIQAEISMGLIDRIFTNSINLSTPGIQHLVNQLCYMSQLELSPESSVMMPIVKDGADSNTLQPRIFSLQKLVEVADFNMDVRGRLIWAGIWETLSGHFSEIGAHENPQLAMYAIDSLRQLAVKFMVKEELRDFNFQRVVLRPFEAITATNSCTEAHIVFILHCLEQLVQARGNSIRSGWKSILAVVLMAIRGCSVTTTNLAWGILQQTVEHKFSALSYDFLDVTKCLLAVVQRQDIQDLSLVAVESLCRCAGFLGVGKGEGLKEAPQEKENGVNFNILTPPPHPHLFDRTRSQSTSTDGGEHNKTFEEEVTSNPPAEVSDETHLCLWWPLLFGLSECVEDPRIEVRHACLEALTSTLENFGSLFSTQTWLLLLKAVLFPIFENTATDLVKQPSSILPTDDIFPPSSLPSSSELSEDNREAAAAVSHMTEAYLSSWTAITSPLALEMICRLLVAHPNRLFPLLFEMLGVYKRCICQEREGLARIGVQGLISLIHELENKYPQAVVERDGQVTMTVWECVTDFICDVLKYNLPSDLLERLATSPPSGSPPIIQWNELEGGVTVQSPTWLMTMMVVSQQLVWVVRDMLLKFGRKGKSSFIPLLGMADVKCLRKILSGNTMVYFAFNDCVPLRISLVQDNFMLHPDDGMKKKGYCRTTNQECNSWIAELQVATLLDLGLDLEIGKNVTDPPELEMAYNELSRIFTSIVSCYCRRQEALSMFRVKGVGENEGGVQALVLHENMESMTPAVIQALKMLQYLSDDQLQKNITWIYSTLVRLIRSDNILIRDAVQEIMSNRLQTVIHYISTISTRLSSPQQPVVQ